jgi:hypothetical protein
MARCVGYSIAIANIARLEPMRVKTRYRIRIWRPGYKSPLVSRYYNNACKLCAINHALEMATEVAANLSLDLETIEWVLEKTYLHLNGWEAVWTNKLRIDPLIKRHGH